MLPHPDDTIIAVSSAPGPGLRGIVRVSGPDAVSVVASVFTPEEEPAPPTPRTVRRGRLRLPEVASPLAADLYFWRAPHTYTGQDLAELHTLSSPPLLEQLTAALLNAGARPAQAGEFTLRAFLAGKRDLTRVEAVMGVVGARSGDELRSALGQLAGGLGRPLEALRDDLLNLLADLEAGLDFAEEDIEFVGREDVLRRLAKGMAQLTLVQKQLRQRSVSGRAFRVVLVGEPNAGKSSLFNALAPAANALVSPRAGTTRDYLTANVDLGGIAAELCDTAGWQDAAELIGEQAQAFGRREASGADLLLWCIAADEPPPAADAPPFPTDAEVVRVATKCDLAPVPADLLATSTRTGEGLEALRSLLAEKARAAAEPALAPSLSRCRHHVDACLERLRKAHSIVLFEEPAELLALEVRLALDHLGEMTGAVYTDDLLDRIFSRFCIGK
ncbi:MAG TPA: GTPase [Gemmataceae bacterium]